MARRTTIPSKARAQTKTTSLTKRPPAIPACKASSISPGCNPGTPAQQPLRPVRPALSPIPATRRVVARNACIEVDIGASRLAGAGARPPRSRPTRIDLRPRNVPAHVHHPAHGEFLLRAALAGRRSPGNAQPGISCQADGAGLTGRKPSSAGSPTGPEPQSGGNRNKAKHVEGPANTYCWQTHEERKHARIGNGKDREPWKAPGGMSDPERKSGRCAHVAAKRPQTRSTSFKTHPLRFRPVRPAPPARDAIPGPQPESPLRPVRPALSPAPATHHAVTRDACVEVGLGFTTRTWHGGQQSPPKHARKPKPPRSQHAPLRFRPVRPALSPAPATRHVGARNACVEVDIGASRLAGAGARPPRARPTRIALPPTQRTRTRVPPSTRRVRAKSCPCRATEPGERPTWHFMPG
jgi:hypothetical protein